MRINPSTPPSTSGLSSRRKLVQINEQAEAARVELSANPEIRAIPFERGVDRSRFWIPENLTHLYHLPVYQEFTHAERLFYNQAFALMVVEQSVLFEEQLSSFIRRAFLHSKKAIRKLPSELKEGIDHFLREEVEHTDLFWKLAHASDSAYQGQRVYRYYRPKLIDKLATQAILSFPRLAILWTWLSLYGEEKFLLNYKEIRKASKSPQTAIDPLHDAVHYWHMVDEARHVQMDEIFVQICWDPAPQWLKNINLALLKRVFRSFVVKSNSAWSLWNIVVEQNPAMGRFNARVKHDLQNLGATRSYQEIMTSRSSIPRSAHLFDARPEFNDFESVLPSYQRRSPA